MEELQQQVLDYLAKVDKAKTKDIATKLGVKKTEVNKACSALAKEGKVEYLYIGTSFVTLAGKDHTPKA
ncbi:MAG: hypothetical protein LRZ99_04920 [Desulfotomaculum sp.]|nr:hypothetical protein [Desulfotomaculum sp.]